MIVKLRFSVYSKDLSSSLSIQKLSDDKLVCGDVSSTWHEFQTDAIDEISWIPGPTSIANPLRKKYSCLTSGLHLTMFTEKLSIDYSSVAETRKFEMHPGWRSSDVNIVVLVTTLVRSDIQCIYICVWNLVILSCMTFVHVLSPLATNTKPHQCKARTRNRRDAVPRIRFWIRLPFFWLRLYLWTPFWSKEQVDPALGGTQVLLRFR